MKSLIVTRKPKRSLEYSHKAIDTLSPAKRVKLATSDDIVEITPSDDLSQTPDIIETPPSLAVEYNASPSWVIPDTDDTITNTDIPRAILESLMTDPFTEQQCKLDDTLEAQACITHGANIILIVHYKE